MADVPRCAQVQADLSQIVEDECRQDDEEPGPGDGQATEVTHIGEPCFGAGDRQHHSGQGDEGGPGWAATSSGKPCGPSGQ
nr:hypothetical protein [Brevibacterium sp. 239c]